MYWIFLVIFIITVLVPDIVRDNFYAISETRSEEILIFLMGAMAFAIFMKNEKQLIFHKREKEKDKKKIEQTVKDLVESYSYIGEVNRKMDLLMNTALGLSDRSALSSSHENETYKSIVSASSFLLKAEFTSLRFVNMENFKTKKEFRSENSAKTIKNTVLSEIEDQATVKKHEDCLIISSNQKINGIKSYLIICDFDEKEEANLKNIEILKVFASQALFLYSYTHKEKVNCPPCLKEK
ncbi:MAG: hypothetical protein COX29_01420 [Candidatus Moranbacteria bacterium CG23_combo_of_CG06-09_8_20_14_all_35_22]|nr:MAG: hypothetical protein COX29_01420 [Candidatus Moranbacteria bacterium CG23_combo_of_CG06-09_8_20_14_all_35_22]